MTVLTVIVAALPGILAGLAALIHSFRIKQAIRSLETRLKNDGFLRSTTK